LKDGNCLTPCDNSDKVAICVGTVAIKCKDGFEFRGTGKICEAE